MTSLGDIHDIASTERAFESEPLPTLTETVTLRSVAVSLVLGTIVSVVVMKLKLTSSFVFLPSLSIPAGLLGFFLVRVWIHVSDIFGVAHLPFTRQENTIIQTCVVACSSIAYNGGFGTYVLGMSNQTNVEPDIGRLMAFLFLINFAGLFMVVPLRKVMIIRHRLTYPSGTAAGHLINSLHTPHDAVQVRKQVLALFKSLGATTLWPIFQWFFAGGKDCGFQVFPTFGITAYRRGFYFDSSMTNVGIGMICAPMISVSMLIGSILSWGILWPCIQTKEGQWYPKNLEPKSLSGITGYKVFIGVSIILADSLFNFIKALVRILYISRKQRSGVKTTATLAAPPPFRCLNTMDQTIQSFDDRQRAHVFLKDMISDMVAIAAYIILATTSTITIPHLYPQLKNGHIALAYMVTPVFAFCNVYGIGVTNKNMSTAYGKVAILVVSSWVRFNGGSELVACGIAIAAVSSASELMQEFKMGYLTLTSSRAMLLAQAIGTAFGCIVNPVIFWMLYKVYDMGVLDFADTPYAKVYRGIVMLSAGRHELPRHSVLLCTVFFLLALALSVAREVGERRQWRVLPYIPSTVAIGVAFFAPPKMPIGMAVGSLALYLWKRYDGSSARALSVAVASGLICGDGLGSVVPSMLNFSKAQAPVCIKFLPTPVNSEVDAYLATHPMST
ncbi:hypothetical protein U9M48_043678 [Paspalum notatum var. saurae]|uniref:Uncharacterized protein n=1 Tax=Paspalum notatum var. saurae TaxID=547442 RepID=A0AAQ3UXN6_PASNO